MDCLIFVITMFFLCAIGVAAFTVLDHIGDIFLKIVSTIRRKKNSSASGNLQTEIWKPEVRKTVSVTDAMNKLHSEYVNLELEYSKLLEEVHKMRENMQIYVIGSFLIGAAAVVLSLKAMGVW